MNDHLHILHNLKCDHISTLSAIVRWHWMLLAAMNASTAN